MTTSLPVTPRVITLWLAIATGSPVPSKASRHQPSGRNRRIPARAPQLTIVLRVGSFWPHLNSGLSRGSSGHTCVA